MSKQKTAEQKTERKMLKITLMKSPIGFDAKQGTIVQSMGLRRIRHSVELVDTPETRGLIHKVRHLVEVDGQPRAKD